MTTGTVLLLTAMFLLAAMLYSSVGHAGASAYLAAMALVGVEPAIMRPTALSLNVLVASITICRFYRAGSFSWNLFLTFALASAPMAFIGGRIALPPEYYKPLVGAVLLFAAARLAIERRGAQGERCEPPSLPIALLAGACLGLLSGLTGTGGGIFLTPLLVLMNWAETRRAMGVSAAFILVNSVAGLLGLISSWQPLPAAIPLWAAAVIVGGLVGAHFGSSRFNIMTLRRLLALVLAIAGTKFVWEGLRDFAHHAGNDPQNTAILDVNRIHR